MNTILVHYLHYTSFAVLFAALAVSMALHKPTVDGTTARKLARIDLLYGFSALLVLATGLLKVFYFGKPPAYYGHNFVFHIKVTVYALAFLMSIYPTMQFIKARKTGADESATYPKPVGIIMRVEMVLLLIIPLLGVMMARGYGYAG